jgi:exopolysaccharide biosynthesis polyprenyl glycosylphosphotransferase
LVNNHGGDGQFGIPPRHEVTSLSHSVMTLAARIHPDRSGQRKKDVLSGFLHRIAITDLLVVIWAVLAAQLLRFGPDSFEAMMSTGASNSLDLNYTAFSVGLIVAWMIMLRLHGAYDQRVLGHGPEEYKAVATASFQLFALLAIASYVLRLEVARGYVGMALPAGVLDLLLARWLWRKWLTLHRAEGLMSRSVLVVGDRWHLESLIQALNSVPEAGYRVVAACCGDAGQDFIGEIPVLGDESEAAEIAQRVGVDTVACTSSSRFDAGGLRHLGWALEGQDINLVVVPRLTDVAGPRVLTRPVAGLSLLHVEAPVFAGPRLAFKTVIDRIAAAVVLVLLSPLFALVAFMIRRDHDGSVFFRQERIGKDGESFSMLKFRTMVVGSEAMLPSLLDRSQGQGPLFKLRDDPRVTHIGARLRRYSLDELPQLINVLRGQMSLVGPRPPLLCEVETYGNDVRRRLLVKPGMTGLWQINGRSDLSWDESVRFDLYYVENWSVMLDLMILWRTSRAVMRSAGAY